MTMRSGICRKKVLLCRRQFKTGKDVRSKVERGYALGLEGKGTEDIRPDWVVGVRRMRDDPEALAGMVNDGDVFAGGGRDGPGAAEEIEGVIGIESALDIEGQVQVEEGHYGEWAVVIAFILAGEVPGGVGDQAGGAADMVVVVPSDLGLEEGVGIFVIGDFFKGQEAGEAFLKGIEAAFDFAFGRGVGGDAVGGA